MNSKKVKAVAFLITMASVTSDSDINALNLWFELEELNNVFDENLEITDGDREKDHQEADSSEFKDIREYFSGFKDDDIGDEVIVENLPEDLTDNNIFDGLPEGFIDNFIAAYENESVSQNNECQWQKLQDENQMLETIDRLVKSYDENEQQETETHELNDNTLWRHNYSAQNEVWRLQGFGGGGSGMVDSAVDVNNYGSQSSASQSQGSAELYPTGYKHIEIVEDQVCVETWRSIYSKVSTKARFINVSDEESLKKAFEEICDYIIKSEFYCCFVLFFFVTFKLKGMLKKESV